MGLAQIYLYCINLKDQISCNNFSLSNMREREGREVDVDYIDRHFVNFESVLNELASIPNKIIHQKCSKF